jgi:hypothetical protein
MIININWKYFDQNIAKKSKLKSKEDNSDDERQKIIM